MWGGALEKADDDPYVSETGEPEYGPSGEDLDRIIHTKSELGPLMLKQVPEGQVMRCIVKREKGMLGFSEDIVLCVQEPSKWENDKQLHRVSPGNGGREGYLFPGNVRTDPQLLHHQVLLAQKKQKSSTLNIHINFPEIMGRQLLGKIRSMDKREYTLYDDGDKKERKELGVCKVTTAGATKPITLEAKVKVDQGALLVDSYDLETVQPKYNKDKGSYYLPFERVGERVTMNSRHNFLLQKSDAKKKRKKPLQIGKIEKSMFALDIRYPLTPLHAFFIVLCHIQE